MNIDYNDSVIDSDDILVNDFNIYNYTKTSFKNKINTSKPKTNNSNKQHLSIDIHSKQTNSTELLNYNMYNYDINDINNLKYINISDISRCLCLIFIFTFAIIYIVIYKKS